MKKTKLLIAIGIILLSVIISIYVYPKMPEKIASHWNSQGIADDYMSKFWGLAIMPIISILALLMFIFLPYIDPLKKNIDKFRNYYENFILLFLGFMFYMYILTVIANLGIPFNMMDMMLPALAILFAYVATLIENSKPNWFIGIRTPWTMSNEKVWEKTHKLAGRLFRISALVILLGMFFHQYAIFFILIPVLVAGIYPVVYSYFIYKKLKR